MTLAVIGSSKMQKCEIRDFYLIHIPRLEFIKFEFIRRQRAVSE